MLLQQGWQLLMFTTSENTGQGGWGRGSRSFVKLCLGIASGHRATTPPCFCCQSENNSMLCPFYSETLVQLRGTSGLAQPCILGR
jgi:hypothetical protein